VDISFNARPLDGGAFSANLRLMADIFTCGADFPQKTRGFCPQFPLRRGTFLG